MFTTGHGPTFRALEYAILKSLCRWHSDFKEYIRISAYDRELREYEVSREATYLAAHPDLERRLNLHPPHSPHPEDCIRVLGENVVIDIGMLRLKLSSREDRFSWSERDKTA